MHKCFHFERWWLEYREVHDLIRESWSQNKGAIDAALNISIVSNYVAYERSYRDRKNISEVKEGV